jgi:uncharacterized iron-regulated membrane protein
VGFVSQVLRHPQQLWPRRVNLQIHLWAGVVLAIYAVLIGVSGAVLVFGAELERLENPSSWPKLAANQPIADLSAVVNSLRATFPHTHVVSIMAPTPAEPVFMAVMLTRQPTTVACSAVTGEVLGEVKRDRSRLEWVYDLHENLFARRTGRVINGICAAGLLLLTITGLVNWWPGVKVWRRAMKIDFRRRWKRVNFDIHSAVGFWSIGFLVVWALSGIYFVWPDRAVQLVNRWSPIVNSSPAAVRVDPNQELQRLDYHAMLAKASSIDRGTTWKGIIFPSSRRSPFAVLQARAPGVGRDYEDTLYFNPYDGQYISMWQYGANKSLGDWIIWLQAPLHFGTHWGLAVKCIWAAMGLAFPVLAVSGVLMYWNRVLSKRWNRLRQAA